MRCGYEVAEDNGIDMFLHKFTNKPLCGLKFFIFRTFHLFCVTRQFLQFAAGSACLLCILLIGKVAAGDLIDALNGVALH